MLASANGEGIHSGLDLVVHSLEELTIKYGLFPSSQAPLY